MGLQLLGTVAAVIGPLRHLGRLLIACVELLIMTGDRRDAEILALRHQVLLL